MTDGWSAGSQVGHLWIRCRSGIDPDPAEAAVAIEAHRANDERGREACDQWSNRASVSRVGHWAVKWNKWRGPRGALSDALYGSRAARALRGADRLASNGICGVEPVAIAERRRFGIVRESFLLTRYLADAQPLPALAPTLSRAAARELVSRVGVAIGALHACGLHHADLKHSNLLVEADGRIVVADLDALVPARRLNWRRRVRALGQLDAYASDLYPWLPAVDRLRFLTAYLRSQPALRSQRRRLVADVRVRAEQQLRTWSRKLREDRTVYPLAPRPTERGGAGR